MTPVAAQETAKPKNHAWNSNDRLGHDAELHEWLLPGVQPHGRKADRLERLLRVLTRPKGEPVLNCLAADS